MIKDNSPAAFWQKNKSEVILFIIMLLLFSERLLALHTLGAEYTLASDDLSYVQSGITFVKTGMITMHDNTIPSAQIMPGMTFITAFFYLLFGQGRILWLALKLFWIVLGTATAWFIYKSVSIFAPKYCALLACLPLFSAEFVWADNIILTETPFIFCFSAMIYFTFLLGRERSRRAWVGCTVFYLLALLLKANIAPYPLFALFYFLAVKYPLKQILIKGALLAGLTLLVLLPWTVRNYNQFHAFVPLTFGAGNPTLMGTYQGYGYPSDESLDYEENVDKPFREKYAAYQDPDGHFIKHYERYLEQKHDGMKAAYRQRVWFNENPLSFLLSYLIIKPKIIMHSDFYWETVLGIPKIWVSRFNDLTVLACLLFTLGAFFQKKNRPQILWLMFLYLGNVGIYALTFAFGRYNFGLAPARLVLIGLGLAYIPLLWQHFRQKQTA